MAGSAVESSRAPSAWKGWEQRIRQVTGCRICGNRRLRPVVDLGAQCLASLFDDGKPENHLQTRVPLQVVRCEPEAGAQGCRFVQLTRTVPPEVLYHDYGYRSGINATMRRHLQDLAQEIESRIPLRRGDIVVDIGANDGTTLLAYRSEGILRVGYEPSNIRPGTAQDGLVYIPTVFRAGEFHSRFPGNTARVVTSIAMFYDIDDPARFCQEVHGLLSEDGVWIIEMSYLGAMLDHHSFDAICHEHLGYYSLATLEHLMQRAGFVFCDVAFNDANGGSIRCYAQKASSPMPVPAANRQRIQQALQDERDKGYHDERTFAQFRRHVEETREALQQTLERLRGEGKRVFGYGASTKGNVVLQYAQVGPQHLTAIADRNPAKVGRMTLGTNIRICSEDEMRRARPEYLVILPWHFLEEFLQREQALRASGTKFIVPFPDVRIV